MDNTETDLRVVGQATLGTAFLSSRQLPPVVTEGLIEEFKDWIEGGVGAQTISQYTKIVQKQCLGKSIAEVNHKSFFIFMRKDILASEKGLRKAVQGRIEARQHRLGAR